MSYPKPDVEYAEHLRAGRFMIQRSRSSGRFVFHPRVAEPVTGARDLEWVEVSGKGTVYAVTVVGQRPPAEPYNVAIVELDEGVRMMTRVDGIASAEVRIGMPVTAVIRAEGEDVPHVVFTPAEGA
ncbi:hypothetical protein GCM10011534_42440 [Pseudooceanicola nanhaiensis]|jgi:uncharacterized OB-fold protein|uniref:ChsH2 C-terminal OB-fold domain-containing protein n=1 Tax=Pseudooceanicola nanhaiensis TaxID=375761 RepID=A0A917WMT4_9RHOB|nr:OB-fold domain-containing protein [Pseudooceanicola nanhaiensis]GGM16009.1 hypothetical protein GCM10011534_42440 [Pseudooceanicola nanhaiensis]